MNHQRRIYLASSWTRSEPHYSRVLKALQKAGHEVYDFKASNANFRWEELDPNWKNWSPSQFRMHLSGTMCADAWKSDYDALNWSNTIVMVEPCGSSAHLELGYGLGKGKSCFVLLNPGFVPELMIRPCVLCTSISELLDELEQEDC